MQIHRDSFPSLTTQKFFGGSMIAGGAALTAITAKTIIAVGFASHLLPVIGNIVGIALMAIGSLLLFFACRKETLSTEQTPNPLTERVVPIEEIEPQEIAIEEVDKRVEIEEKQTVHSPLELTISDKLIAGSNLIQWGLIGMSLYGVPPTITFPLNALAGLGTDVMTFCSLPKDVSWLRKALSISTLSKLIVQYNPWVARLAQAGSFYYLANGSKNKAQALWEGVKTGGIKTLSQNKIHLFNLVSNITFAAESVGLVNLRSHESHQDLDSKTEITQEAILTQEPLIANGSLPAPPEQPLPEPLIEKPKTVIPPQVVTKQTFIAKKCDGTDGKTIKCTSFWNNIQKAKEWLDEPAKVAGEWRVFGEKSINEDDYTGQEASFIETGNDSFIIRNDEKAKEHVGKIWKFRGLAPFFKPVLT